MHRFLARPPRGSQITSQGKEKEPNTAINLITPASHQDSAAASSQNAQAVAPVHLNPKSNYISDSLDLGLERVFGHSSFRTDQKKIVQVIAEGRRDVFVIMPTGGGKSLLYQLPAILSKGVTIVISPLISLIEDQVSTLINMDSGGIPAAYLNSTCSKKMQDMVYMDLQRAHHGEEPYLKLLYVTPERVVKSDDFGNYLTELFNNEFLARFVIDEAHCVSSWGHDFRKDYGKLGILRTEFPDVPIIALTATARQNVAEDVMKICKIPNCAQFSSGFDRKNLYFEVRKKPDSRKEQQDQVLQYLLSYEASGSTGIVYCMTRKETELTSDFLHSEGICCDYYHAGQTPKERKSVQEAWLCGAIQVVCATIAYGMGIDKPDVRFVLHTSLAKSLEGYYQEAGRAGRDGQRSECVLLYHRKDVTTLRNLVAVKSPRRKASPKDDERLEEMTTYCEELQDCRRRVFATAFGSSLKTGTKSSSSSPSLAAAAASSRNVSKRYGKTSASSSKSCIDSSAGAIFHKCRNMCDNCTEVRNVYVRSNELQERQERAKVHKATGAKGNLAATLSNKIPPSRVRTGRGSSSSSSSTNIVGMKRSTGGGGGGGEPMNLNHGDMLDKPDWIDAKHKRVALPPSFRKASSLAEPISIYESDDEEF